MNKDTIEFITNLPRRSFRFTARQIYSVLKKIFHHKNPYNFIQLYKPDLHIQIVEKDYIVDKNFPKYSVLTPVLNEASNIERVLASIESQTYLPDEVIIVDGGSIDNTIELIENYKKKSKLNIIAVQSPIRNLGAQRNFALKQARNNIILHIDAGTLPDKNYAVNMIGPFTEYENIDLVGGVSLPMIDCKWSGYFTFRDRKKHFKFHNKPNGNVVAYKRDIRLKALFPEYLTCAGEDTLFFYKYQKLSKNWVFNRNAFILWDVPTTIEESRKKLRLYMLGNFEIGLWPYFYYNYVLYSLLYKLGYSINIDFELFQKHKKDFLPKQAQIEIQKRQIKGLCFIIANARIEDDSSKKHREYAIKMIDKNYKVFFINQEDNRRNSQKIYLDTDITLLELIPYKYFSVEDFYDRYGVFLDKSIFILTQDIEKLSVSIDSLKKNCPNIKIMYDIEA
jgi:glycosyltransferase involved in cell wall biosynthesis